MRAKSAGVGRRAVIGAIGMAALFLALSPLVIAAQSSGRAATTAWNADPVHSGVTFRARHLGLSWVRGEFTEWTAVLNYDPQDPAGASVAVTIKAASVDTRTARRDNDVRQNYFEVESFPEIRFVSTGVVPTAQGALKVTGDLTIKGITRSVVLDVEVGGVLATPRERRVAFSASTSIRRQDFGITRNILLEGAQVVGDVIQIQIELEATAPAG